MTCNEISSLYIICGLIVPTASAAVYTFCISSTKFCIKDKNTDHYFVDFYH